MGSNYGKGVIVGVPPPPAKWKGKGELKGTGCDNKLIGARNFDSGSTDPPIDEEGHRTHTASTATGNFVNDANVFGQANGTAVGMAPLSHLAIYKVCSESGCGESDILAGMDTAVEDGVDVLSLSLDGGSNPFCADGIAVGTFTAIQNGIFVNCSAGNFVPYDTSLLNEAPWILTVGASTIDRSIKTTVVLGSTEEYDGESLFQPADCPSTLVPRLC